MQFSEVSIVTPTALYVQMLEAENAPVKKQVRIKRSDIDRDDISAGAGPSHSALPEEGARRSYSCHARE